MVLRRVLLLVSTLAWAGCGMEGDGEVPPDWEVPHPDAPPTVMPDVADQDCPPMFAQHVLPEYFVDIAPDELAALEDEFRNRVQREAQGLETHPYHPVGFRMGRNGPPIPNVRLRLKGASSWLHTIRDDPNPKMQFVIAFNEVNPDQRFFGVRKLELDMPRTDQTFIRQRLALYQLRAAGVPAQCANNAKLYINGTYYGLYTNLERPDKEWLQRLYPEGDDADGDLWKGGRNIKTNEETFTWDRIDAFWNGVATADELALIADLPASMEAWAAEATIGAADGYYNGRANFYLYDHPRRGFVWIPHDLDTAWDRDFLPYDASLTMPACVNRWERDWTHFLMVVNDPVWVEEYVTAVATLRGRMDVDLLERRADELAAQIDDAAQADPHRPFDMAAHDLAVEKSREYIRLRAGAIDAWLACRGGGGTDADGDGFTSCFECNDFDATVSPRAAETCNRRDDDCDGRTDDGLSCPP